MERRKFSRIAFQAPAEIIYAGNAADVELIDLSLKGILLSLTKPLDVAVHSHIDVAFHLPQSQIVVSLSAEVIDNSANKLRCKVENIDLDSISHLKRLVELNLADDALLERELEHLLDD